MDSKITDIDILLDKINRLMRNFRNEDPTVHRVEVDLFKDYALQLYARLVEYDVQKKMGTPEVKTEQRNLKEETVLPVAEKKTEIPSISFVKPEEEITREVPVKEEKKEPEVKKVSYINPGDENSGLFPGKRDKQELQNKKVSYINSEEESSTVFPVREEKKTEKIPEKKPEVDLRAFEEKKAPEVQTEKIARKTVNIMEDEENEEALHIGLKHNTDKTILAEKITSKKAGDLRSTIDLNDKFFFIKELFKGDHNAFDKAIRYINGLTDFDAAKRFIEKELALNYHWRNDEPVERLLEVVKVKFN